MSSKLIGTFFRSVCYMFFVITTLLFNTSHAMSWAEISDAGDLINTAQTPAGTGSINTITGTITTSFDVDMYKIHISNPNTFSATVFGGEGQNGWDSWLMLFDKNGFGIYRNDDAVFDNGNSGLPSNHASGPQVAGDYFLAISDDDRGPLSGTASSISDLIFPTSSFPYTEISGPTGDGGTLPLAGWGSLIAEVTLNANYGINLTGAKFVTSVPVPTAIWMFGFGIVGLFGMRRKIS